MLAVDTSTGTMVQISLHLLPVLKNSPCTQQCWSGERAFHQGTAKEGSLTQGLTFSTVLAPDLQTAVTQALGSPALLVPLTPTLHPLPTPPPPIQFWASLYLCTLRQFWAPHSSLPAQFTDPAFSEPNPTQGSYSK